MKYHQRLCRVIKKKEACGAAKGSEEKKRWCYDERNIIGMCGDERRKKKKGTEGAYFGLVNKFAV